MTVAAYYAEHVAEGRAPLGDRGKLEPATWIVRVRRHEQYSYWLCHRDLFSIEQVDPERDVATIRTKAARQPRKRQSLTEWLDRMARETRNVLQRAS